MSSLPEQLGSLRLGGMPPTTRRQARRQEQGDQSGPTRQPTERQTEEVSGRHSMIPSAPPPEIQVRQRHERAHNAPLSPGSLASSAAGISAQRVNSFQIDNRGYTAFALLKPDSIRISDPASGSMKISCTCEYFQLTDAVCTHVYWLYDGLNIVLADEIPPPPPTLTKEGIVARLTTLYGRIEERMDSLPERLNRSRDEPQNLSDARRRAQGALNDLDRYASTGHSGNPIIDEDGVYGCVRLLRPAVNAIRRIRDDRAHISVTPGRRAAEILVEILEDVCNRNSDIFAGTQWKRDVSESEDETDRNLYAHLIGNPPGPDTFDVDDDEEVPGFMTDAFVIEALHRFPPEEWKHLIERLNAILDLVQRNGAPNNFIEKLEGMITDYAEVFYEPSTSASRRPSVDAPRDTQRRRLR